jgi:hypothetical protein
VDYKSLVIQGVYYLSAVMINLNHRLTHDEWDPSIVDKIELRGRTSHTLIHDFAICESREPS